MHPLRFALTSIWMVGTLIVAPFPVAQGAQPVSGATVTDALNQLFPRHEDLAKDTRFAITIRYLPPSGRESQIGIAYHLDKRSAVTLSTTSESVSQALNEPAAAGQNHFAKAVSRIHINTQTVALDSGTAKQCLSEFWSSILSLARIGPGIALKYDGTQEVDVALDATMYQIHYSDAENEITLSVEGPDPEWSGDLEKLDPVVKWALGVRRQIISISEKKGGNR